MTPTKKLLAGVTALGLVVAISACIEYKSDKIWPEPRGVTQQAAALQKGMTL